jgi:hypothetical protein
MPQWIRGGYADYAGKGAAFNYDEARQCFLSGAPEMDFGRSGLYRRFNLLVAYLPVPTVAFTSFSQTFDMDSAARWPHLARIK